MPAPRLTFLVALAACLLGLTSLRAGEGGFVATLSQDQKNLAGLSALAPAELAALDRIVADEVGLARQQSIGEFSENFVARRSADERQLAGLDRLSPEQQAKLNELVAAAIASRPKPKERPRLKDSEVLAPVKPAEIHGSVTLSYGWGGGGTIRGESLWLDYYDPTSRVGIGIGLSNYSGNGFYGYYPDSGYGSRYYGGAPVYLDAAYRGGAGNDFAFGQGQSFCTEAGWDAMGRGGRRR